MNKRRVVITGLGMLSPLGLNVKDTWKHIINGVSGVTTVETFDVSDFSTKISASVKNFNPAEYFSPKDARKNDLFLLYGLAAADEAIQDAGLEVTEANADRIGVAIGSGIGGIQTIEENQVKLARDGSRRISPFFIPSSIINMISGQLSIRKGFRGPNIAIVTACTTGTHNIGHAARIIQYGDADVMIAGGAEMATTPLGLGGFAACKALSKRNDEPEKASRPWDRDRDGFVLGDGAGCVVLEEYEHAKARGANIYGELTGFGMSADAYHMTLPQSEGEGARKSMQNAMHDAGCNPEDIDYINAHGTSTPAGDEVEVLAVKNALGESAYKLAVSSTKSMTGHLLGAAGAVEAIFCLLAMRDNIAPPTINLDNPDEGCDLNFVAHTAQEMKINTALSNSFGFGGTNGTLIFSRI